MNRNTLGLLLLATIAIAAFALQQWWQKAPVIEEPQVSGSIDYYLNNAKITVLGNNGHALYRLTATRAEHDKNQQRIHLNNITLDYWPPGAPTGEAWQLSANSGWLPDDRSVVHLHGDVIANYVAKRNPGVFSTDRLAINPATHIATSETPITLRQHPGTLSSKKMALNLLDGRVTLTDRVRGRYVP